MEKSQPSIVLAGGGTAGHIEPALAVGEALRERHGVDLTAIGTARGLETSIVPERGVELRLIDPVPVPRTLSPDLLKLPFRVVKAVRQARRILRETRADALFGTGGYVAAPAYVAARSLGLPFYVLEPNVLAGMANKLGVRLGGTGFNAVADSGMPGEVTGIPVRSGVGEDPEGVALARARRQWGLAEDRPTLLVTGGSQGAASLNRAVAGAVDRLVAAGFQVLHAYGRKNAAPGAREHYVPLPYIEDMAAAYAVADLIVCRSGAMTVAEVTAASLPAVYVPLPHGNGEQGLNATGIVAAGAARLVDDADLDPDLLVEHVTGILAEPVVLERMRTAAAGSGAGDVAARLADRIIADLSAS